MHLGNRNHDGVVSPISDEQIHHVVDSGGGAVSHVDVVRVAWIAIPTLYGIRNKLSHHKCTGTLTVRAFTL